MTLVQNIAEIFIEILQGLATAIGSSLNEMVTALFTTGTGETMALSAFGSVMVIFAGVALVFGLTRFITSWVTGWGN